ncbi:MAG: hypothetical protein WC365_04905 [Candidatus Babeliales bacterium]|jgi:hypothetical protein
MIVGKSISKQELLDRLTREIKTLVEMIMNPHTTDERRKELNASYNEKLSAFQKLGGVFNEYLAQDGWHPNADLGKTIHNKDLEAERLKR